MNKTKNLLAFIFITAALINIAAHYLAGHSTQDSGFNSDALYLPTLFSDILSKNGDIKDWLLTPAPYFFPDYPIFLPAYLAGTGPYSQVVIFSLIQAVLTLLAVWFLAKRTLNPNPFFTASTISTSLTWLALTSGEPFVFFLSSAFHYGIFLIAIVFIAILIKKNDKSERQSKPFFYLLVASLAFFSALSDNLFIVQVIIPLIGTAILISIAKLDFSLRSKFPLIVATVFSILGSISYTVIVANNTRYKTSIGIEKLPTNLNDIYTFFYTIIINNSAVGVLLLFYAVVVSHSFYQLMTGATKGNQLSRVAIFSFSSLCATIAAISLITNLPVTGRYLIPALFWPVIVVFIFLSNYFPRQFILAATIVSFLAALSLSWSSYQLIENNGVKIKNYPSDISCIDDILKTERVTSGIAQYWDAKYLQNLSRLDLNIAQHYDNLDEMRWITSMKYFKQSYDFAIISENAAPPYKISSAALIRLNGTPKTIKSCGSRTVYIYDKDKLRVKKIINVGDSYTWKACELPTVIGKKTATCEMENRDDSGTRLGYVTFGPYERLPTGQYTFEIAYSSTAGKTDTAGNWDVVLALPDDAKILGKGIFTGTDGVPDKIKGTFSLSAGENMEKVEIRTLAQQHNDFKVIYIQVTRMK